MVVQVGDVLYVTVCKNGLVEVLQGNPAYALVTGVDRDLGDDWGDIIWLDDRASEDDLARCDAVNRHDTYKVVPPSRWPADVCRRVALYRLTGDAS